MGNTAFGPEIASEMSKSRPETSIFVHDSADEIARKMGNAYCPAKVVAGNPVLEYAKYIVFRKSSVLRVERPAKYGGAVDFATYGELEEAFRKGELHPTDLKQGVAAALEGVVAPIRVHFEKDPAARRLYESVKSAEVTR